MFWYEPAPKIKCWGFLIIFHFKLEQNWSSLCDNVTLAYLHSNMRVMNEDGMLLCAQWTNIAGFTYGHCRVSQQKTNFTGHCFEIAMKADTYWTTCRYFCKRSTCIISLNTLKISLGQVLLPLFYILVWLSNWTSKVTQLVIGRARIWAQAILP